MYLLQCALFMDVYSVDTAKDFRKGTVTRRDWDMVIRWIDTLCRYNVLKRRSVTVTNRNNTFSIGNYSPL